jgi:hypothetical protein
VPMLAAMQIELLAWEPLVEAAGGEYEVVYGKCLAFARSLPTSMPGDEQPGQAGHAGRV